jgi:beta-phosphoglucomutase
VTAVDALIFDMDGVLVHSNPLHCEAWEKFNLRYGLVTTPEMHERMYGRRNDQIVRDFFGELLDDAEVAARGRAKEELYRDMLGCRVEELLVPGVRAFLDKHRGLPMALATNAQPENVDFLLDRARLRRNFAAVVDGDQVKNPKPHPEIYLRAADLLGVKPERCVVFEDSHSGVAAAVAAGMRVIGLRTTYVNLPGTCLTVDNFLSGDLEEWLEAQTRPV